jgi:hypothetical protein
VFLVEPTTWTKIISLLTNAPLNIVQTRLHSFASPIAGAWLLAHPSICSAHFLTTFHICLGISHPIVPHLSQCQCGHTIYDLEIHLLYCSCGIEHTTTHDTFWNTIVAIMSKSGAQVQREVSTFFLTIHKNDNILYILKYNCSYHVEKWSSSTKRGFHLFPHHTQKRQHIVITRNRFRTLVNFVIVDPTHIDLVQQASMTTCIEQQLSLKTRHDPTKNECQKMISFPLP